MSNEEDVSEDVVASSDEKTTKFISTTYNLDKAGQKAQYERLALVKRLTGMSIKDLLSVAVKSEEVQTKLKTVTEVLGNLV